MRFFDLLFMSIGNLWKRKLRTVLTVLGVVIGVTSIVVMMALGNGLKESMLESYSSYASMTEIQVNSGGSGYYSSGSSSTPGDTEEKFLNQEFIDQLLAMEHVTGVEPELSMWIMLKCGRYRAELDIIGLTQESIKKRGYTIAEGTLPPADESELKVFYGNNVLMQFYVESTYFYPWYENQEAPDVDLMNDPIFYIFDRNAYWNSQGSDSTTAPPKKYIIEASGLMAGELGEWDNNDSSSIICDIDALKAQLKRVFRKNPIPGQPTRKNGKPYDEIFYSTIRVQVDEMENVADVTKAIQDMGYNAYNNAEWIQQNMEQMNTIQAVLGAIGAVAMLVAAISITNTMMMSIYERTKEIGVMKVLGCNIRNIQALFLLEAGFIGFLGGMIGLALSYGLSFAINSLAASGGDALGLGGSICRIPLWLVPVAVIFAVVVGMVAGFIPSLRAMRLSPLAAIRNE